MRAEIGPAAADVLFLLAGFGVLNAVGLIRPTLRELIAATGLAFLAGLSVVMLIGIVLLCLGSSFRLPIFVVVSLGVAVAGLLARRDWLQSLRRPALRPPLLMTEFRRASLQVKLATGALIGFAVYAAYGFAAAGVKPMTEWDAWSLWARKGVAIFYYGSLPVDMFTRSVYTFQHPDYPLLLPLFESVQFRAMGGLNTWAVHAQFWLLLVTFVWALVYLGLRRGAFLTWTPIAVAVGVAPGVYGQLMTAYADLPLALLLTLGVLLLAEWLRTGEGSVLAIAILFLAAAANTKNEGLVASAVALAVAGGIVVFTRRWSRLRFFGLGVLGYLVGVLPWRIWVSAHGVYHDVPVLKGLTPSYLADRLDRVWPSVQAMYAQVIDQTSWLYIVPLAAALAIASFVSGRRREQAVFFFATAVIFFAAVVWTFWVATVDPLSVFLSQSAYRLVASIAAISLAAVLELSAPLIADERPG
jgi:hypothetical protein